MYSVTIHHPDHFIYFFVLYARRQGEFEGVRLNPPFDLQKILELLYMLE